MQKQSKKDNQPTLAEVVRLHKQGKKSSRRERHVQEKFVLQRDLKDDRLILASEKLKDCNLIDVTNATCWLEAKQQLGYELTPLQAEKLAKHKLRMLAPRDGAGEVVGAANVLKKAA